ncbi:MAG: hypothetical protein ACYDCH_13685 [Gaiellaceae bacterium]
MALSFEDKIKAFIRHRLEQQPSVQAATTQGERFISTQEALDYMGASMRTYQDAILLIAREIDELRAAIEGRED